MVRKRVLGFTALFVAFTFFLISVQFAITFDKGITGFSVYDSGLKNYSFSLFEGTLAFLLIGAVFIVLSSLKPRYFIREKQLKLVNLNGIR